MSPYIGDKTAVIAEKKWGTQGTDTGSTEDMSQAYPACVMHSHLVVEIFRANPLAGSC